MKEKKQKLDKSEAFVGKLGIALGGIEVPELQNVALQAIKDIEQAEEMDADIIDFSEGRFSFALGSEIGLRLAHFAMRDIYILEGGYDFWKEVRARVISCNENVVKLVKWWIEQSKKHEISFWSGPFSDLDQFLSEKEAL